MSELQRAHAALVTGRLTNGLSYAIWPDARDTIATVQLWVRAGTSDEAPGETGIAHMLEHMMFRGSATYPDGAFDEQMERLGASVNAATWLDYTFYTTTMPVDALDRVLELEADRFGALAIAPAAFAAERDVVANERRQVVDANPDARLSERFHALALRGTVYEWPTIGWAQDIEAYTVDRLTAFYRRAYAPANVCAVVSGAVDPAHVIEQLTRRFGGLPGGEAMRRAGPLPFVEEPVRLRERLPIQSRRLLMAWPAPARVDGARPAWRMFTEIFGAAESSRLPRRLESRDRLVLDVSCDAYPFRLPSLFEVSANLRRGVGEKRVIAAINEELRRVAEEGVTEEELEGARARLLTATAMDLADTASRAERVGEAWAVAGDISLAFNADDALDAVDAAAVREVARALVSTTPAMALGVPDGATEAA